MEQNNQTKFKFNAAGYIKAIEENFTILIKIRTKFHLFLTKLKDTLSKT
jgi:UTP:GlnB (protein PII) uridylyltransferase